MYWFAKTMAPDIWAEMLSLELRVFCSVNYFPLMSSWNTFNHLSVYVFVQLFICSFLSFHFLSFYIHSFIISLFKFLFYCFIYFFTCSFMCYYISCLTPWFIHSYFHCLSFLSFILPSFVHCALSSSVINHSFCHPYFTGSFICSLPSLLIHSSPHSCIYSWFLSLLVYSMINAFPINN